MPEGGEIVFKTTDRSRTGRAVAATGSLLLITVEDTGEGMDESVRERVFEPFFTTKPPGKGTGMGLAAAYGTVASHDGRIEIASQMGRGTTVSVVLPRSPIRQDQGRHHRRKDRARRRKGAAWSTTRTAFVRRSRIFSRASVVRWSRSAGRGEATSTSRRTGADVDLVILDLVLPDMNGREALAVLREINPEVRVLLVSGYTADDELRQLLRSDAIEFLEKPFLLADLAESLTRLTGSR